MACALGVLSKGLIGLLLPGWVLFIWLTWTRQWRKVLALVPEDSPVAAGIQGSIRDAENRMAIAGQQGEARARGLAGRDYALAEYDRQVLAARFVRLVDDLAATPRRRRSRRGARTS